MTFAPDEDQVLSMIASVYLMEVEAGQKGCCVNFPEKLRPQINGLRKRGLITVRGEWCKPTTRGLEASKEPGAVGLLEINAETQQ